MTEPLAPPQPESLGAPQSLGRFERLGREFKRTDLERGFETKAIATEFEVNRKKRTFSGAFAHFGSTDLVSDILAPGSGSRTLKDRWPQHLIKTFYDHKYACGPRPLSIEVKGDLLYAECSVTNIPDHDFILAELEDKTLAHGSIGWIPREFHFETIESKKVRVVTDFDLIEVSPVYFPANPLATLGGLMKSAQPTFTGAETKSLFWLANGIWQLDNALYAVRELATYLRAEGSGLTADEQGILQQLLSKLPEINAALLVLQTTPVLEPAVELESVEAKTEEKQAPSLAGVLGALQKRIETFSTRAA